MKNSSIVKVSAGFLLSVAATVFAAVGQGADKGRGPAVPGVDDGAAQADGPIEETFLGLHPEGGILNPAGRVRRAWGARLATGATPSEAGTRFFARWAGLWGVDAASLQPGGPFEDARHVLPLSISNGDDAPNGFHAIYFTQTAAGLPVYRAFGWAVATEAEGFPVVLAGGSMRPVADMAAQAARLPRDLSSLDPSVFARKVATAFDRMPRVSTPRAVVWAGIDDEVQPARVALQFIADDADPSAVAIRQSYECVVDPFDGTVLHQESRILHATVAGSVTGMATEGPKADVCSPEASRTLPYAAVTLGSSTVYTDAAGAYSATVTGSVPVQASIANGKYFKIQNQGAATITVPAQTASSGTVNFAFNPAPTELATAQVNAYLHSNIVRDFAIRACPNFPTITTQVSFPVNVNINSSCNAYYDGSSINFYRTNGGCNNTAFSPIVHHEYGHHLVNCGGSGQGAFGEGFGDVMGALINDDPALAVGFQSCSGGIRNAANTCQYSSASCSSCGSQIHACGQLLSGIVWDLRQLYASRFGATAIDRVAALAVNEVMMHAGQSDIGPDIRIDYLTLDDNNGNLGDGTPNSDLINEAFRRHGISGTPTPTGLAASDGTFTDKVRLTWSAGAGVSGYKIFRAVSGGAASQIGTSTAATYDDTTVTPGTTYTYTVRATGPDGDSGSSVGDTGFASAPTGPTGFAASDGTSTTGVALSWNAMTGASAYKVRRWTPMDAVRADGTGMTLPDVATVSRTVTVPATVPGNVAGLRLTLDGLQHTYQGDLVVTLRHAGVDCIIASKCNSSTDLNGTYVLDDLASGAFCSQRAVGGSYKPSNAFAAAFAGKPIAGDWTLIFSDTAGADTGNLNAWSLSIDPVITPTELGSTSGLAFEDRTASPGVVYAYGAVATVSGSDTGLSNVDTGWRGLAAPIGVAATDGAFTTKVTVAWGAVTGATGYKVMRRVPSGTAAQIGTTTTATSFDDTSAALGTVYAYSVIATCAAGGSAASAEDTGFAGSTTTPTGVAASDGTFSDKVQISWNGVSGASAYKIHRGASSSSLVQIGTSSVTSFVDASAQPGVVYAYAVSAVLAGSDGPMSVADSGWRNLVAPASLVATSGTLSDRVDLSWGAVSGATGYRVLRSQGTGAAVAIGTAASTAYSDTTAVPGTLHTYFVVAVSAGGDSQPSGGVTGWRNLSAPTGVAASDGTAVDKVTVTWATVATATGYEVHRSVGGGAAARIGTASSTTYDDATAQAGTVYAYSVKAVHPLGITAASASDTGWRNVAAPTGIAATDGTLQDRVQVAWSAVTGATGYKVFRGASASTLVQIGTATASPYDDTSAVPGVNYLYAVRAVTGAGDSALSGTDAGFRALPPAITLAASDGTSDKRVDLSWNGIAGAASHRVLRGVSGATLSASGPGVSITDHSTSNSTATVAAPAEQLVSSVKVRLLNLRHTYQADLVITLSHGGVDCVIGSNCNGSRDLVGDYEISDEATTFLCAQPAMAGAYKPSTALGSKFSGMPAAGAWTLRIQDTAGADVGSMASWTVEVMPLAQPTLIATVPGTDTSYADLQAQDSTLYTYRVEALAGDGRLLAAGEDTGWRNVAGPQAVTASDGAYTDRVAVTWAAMTGVTQYKVFRQSGTSTPVLLGTATTTSYSDTTALAGVRYGYSVRGVRAIGDTMPSAADEGWVLLAAPTGLVATDGGPSVVVSWGSVARATGYQVHRGSLGSEISVNGAGMALPDVATVSSTATLNTTDTGRIGSIRLTMRGLRHTWQGDLIVTLSHNGRSCVLFANCNGSTDLNGDYVFEDSASAAICSQPAAGGRYRPSGSLLGTFGHDLPGGSWTLTVRDTASADVGSIASWSVGVSTYSTLSPLASVTGTSFTDASATSGVMYVYGAKAMAGTGESPMSNLDMGYAGTRFTLGGADDGVDGGKDGSAGGGGGLALSGRERWVAAMRDRRKAAALAGGAGDERPSIPLDLLFAPIAADDPAWMVDCATETAEAASALVEAGSQDLDADGEPDLCQREFGDFDLNGSVDLQDLNLLLLNFGEVNAPFGDLNRDGVVNGADVELLTAWIGDESIAVIGAEAPPESIDWPDAP